MVSIAVLSNCSSGSSLRNEYIGDCRHSYHPTKTVTFICVDIERKTNFYCSELAETIQFENCQLSLIKFNIPKGFHTLNLSSIELQSLPNNNFFYGANKLTTLIASNNRLKEIPSMQFSYCPVLKDVDFSVNEISHIEEDAFVGVSTIKKLNLSGNHITTLPSKTFASLWNLEIVDLSNNAIVNLPSHIFANVPTLETLDLSFNCIGNLQDSAIFGQPNLQFILLAHNNLTTIEMATFAKQKKLSSLDLSFNSIKRIDFSARSLRMEHLEKFHINDNNLYNLDGFSNLLFPNLNSFDISGNQFTCSYLKKFVEFFKNHSSFNVLHRTSSPVNDEEEDLGCIKYENPSTLHFPQTENILIVLCVLVALIMCIMLVKVILNRKTNSSISATNFNRAYSITDISQKYPHVTEHQYDTILYEV